MHDATLLPNTGRADEGRGERGMGLRGGGRDGDMRRAAFTAAPHPSVL